MKSNITTVETMLGAISRWTGSVLRWWQMVRLLQSLPSSDAVPLLTTFQGVLNARDSNFSTTKRESMCPSMWNGARRQEFFQFLKPLKAAERIGVQAPSGRNSSVDRKLAWSFPHTKWNFRPNWHLQETDFYSFLMAKTSWTWRDILMRKKKKKKKRWPLIKTKLKHAVLKSMIKQS